MTVNKTLLSAICATLALALTSFAEVAVISNKGVSAKALDVDQLKNLYMLDSKSIGSTKAVLFNLKENEGAKTEFFKALGTTPDAIKKVWLKAKLTGSGEPPTGVTEEEMVQKVAATSGGVGYVSADKVNAAVKVLYTIK